MLRARIKNSIRSYPLKPSGGGFDPSAQAFITAAGITGATQQAALNQLVLDLKGKGSTTNNTDVWSKTYAVYPFCPIDGSTANATCYKFNLIDPRDLDAAFRLTFFNTPLFSVSNGLEQNGTGNGYANTHFIESANMVIGNNGFTFAQKNEPVFPLSYTGGDQTIFSLRKLSNNYTPYSGSQSISTSRGPNGIITMSRRSATDMEAYYNGASVGTNITSSSTQSAADFFILGVNGGAGTPSDYAEGDIDFAAIHDGLTDNEAQDIYDAITAWRTSLGR